MKRRSPAKGHFSENILFLLDLNAKLFNGTAACHAS